MSKALNEKPNAEPLPTVASAGAILNGRYLPPPEAKDGKVWVRTSVLIHADAEDLYSMWHDVEGAPLWQEQIEKVTLHRGNNIALGHANRRYKLRKYK